MFILDIDDFCDRVLAINKQVSQFKPGIFKDRGTFEAVMSKSVYFDEEAKLDYFVTMFVSLQKCYVFHDGNKRTSLSLFVYCIEEICGLNLIQIADGLPSAYEYLADIQVSYIEHQIDEERFKRSIYAFIDQKD